MGHEAELPSSASSDEVTSHAEEDDRVQNERQSCRDKLLQSGLEEAFPYIYAEYTNKEIFQIKLLQGIVGRNPAPAGSILCEIIGKSWIYNTHQYPVGPKYGPRSGFWMTVGPIATINTTKNHPAASRIQECTAESVTRRAKSIMKTCSDNTKDLLGC